MSYVIVQVHSDRSGIRQVFGPFATEHDAQVFSEGIRRIEYIADRLEIYPLEGFPEARLITIADFGEGTRT